MSCVEGALLCVLVQCRSSPRGAAPSHIATAISCVSGILTVPLCSSSTHSCKHGVKAPGDAIT